VQGLKLVREEKERSNSCHDAVRAGVSVRNGKKGKGETGAGFRERVFGKQDAQYRDAAGKRSRAQKTTRRGNARKKGDKTGRPYRRDGARSSLSGKDSSRGEREGVSP